MPLLRRDTDRTSVEHRPTPGRSVPAATRPGIDTRGTPQPNPQQPIERLLFVADDAVAGADELPPQVRAVIDAAAEVYVVTPTLPGRLAWLADDVDRFRHSADERLDTVLGQMRSIRGARQRRCPPGQRDDCYHGRGRDVQARSHLACVAQLSAR